MAITLKDRARIAKLRDALKLVLKGFERGYLKDQTIITTMRGQKKPVHEALSVRVKRVLKETEGDVG